MHTRKFTTFCPFCSKGCLSVFDLKRHLKTVHNAILVKEPNPEMLDADGSEAIEVMNESMIVGEEAIHIVEEDGMEGITEEGSMQIVDEGTIQVVGGDGIHIVSHEQAMELISQEGMHLVEGQYIQANVGQDVHGVDNSGQSGNEVVLLQLEESSLQR